MKELMNFLGVDIINDVEEAMIAPSNIIMGNIRVSNRSKAIPSER